MPGHAILASDTTPAFERRQIECWRRMTPADKLECACQLSVAVLELARAGIRLRYPGASERECLLRLRQLTLGRELALRVYPEIAGLRD